MKQKHRLLVRLLMVTPIFVVARLGNFHGSEVALSVQEKATVGNLYKVTRRMFPPVKCVKK
ncbi:hypothetical protein JMF94_05240 [Desulfovibrio sp. UIB00]|uniref:hypothetical protein n=1 Tax=Desulfovibrio sp. UIB00 TaxID=2804314 RepID=UPI001F11327C|nr:hypothetical protein [Desulfovibrio sp. UIB00]MCH5144485.1 hypothetical protein [Desulfovibrio sp. UIB00]